MYLSYMRDVGESNEVYLMAAEGQRTLMARGKFHVRSDTRVLSFATAMGSLKKKRKA